MPGRDQETLELLLQVSRLLSSKLDISDLLHTVMDLAARVVGAESASLLLLDEATQELYFDVALGLDEEFQKIRLKLGQGIAGAVAKEEKPLIINDVRQDPRWTQKVDEQSGFQTRSILAAPMTLRGKLIGVVEALNHMEGPFTKEDLETFEAFASHAAIAIENARLFSSLKEEKRNLNTVFSQMREGAVLTDPTGAVVLVNDCAASLLGIGPGKLDNIAKITEQFEVNPPVIKTLVGRERVQKFEAVREKPKKLILEGTAIRLEAPKTKAQETVQGWIWIIRDVTEEKREEGLKRDFLSLISHKLRTPLSSIVGYSFMLQAQKSSLPEFFRKPLATIHEQGQKLASLVEKLLKFTTLEDLKYHSLKRSPLSLGELVQEVLKEDKTALEAGVKIERRGPLPGKVLGDPDLIKEVIRNLVENAVKFSAGPGKKIVISFSCDDKEAGLAVTDSGRGIPAEDQEKIFSGFHQVEADFTGQMEGWGLGLPLVKKVIEQHKGSLKFESTVGKGTTVSFTLPLAQ